MTLAAGIDVEAPPGTRKLLSIQVARGFAALAVVGYHAALTQPKYFGGTDVLPGFFSRGEAGVDLFFVISGFVMVLTTRGRHGSPRQVGTFLWNRFFRIYPTLWVYCLALLPVLVLLPGFVNSSQGGEVNILASFLLFPTETYPLVLVAWTLSLEVWFYLVFALILFLPERFLIPSLGAWFAALVAINWGGPIAAAPALELPTNALAIEFIFGALAALYFRRLPRIPAAILAVAGVVIVVFFGVHSPSDFYAGPGLERPLTLGLGFALVMLGVTAIENRSGLGPVGRLAFLGDMSYSVYLCHVMVLAVMGRVWASMAGPFAGNAVVVWVWWGLTLAVVLAVGYVSYRLVERPVMRFAAAGRNVVFPKPRRSRRSLETSESTSAR